MALLNLVGARNPYSTNIDIMGIEEIIRLINEEEKTVPFIVEREIPKIVEVAKRSLSAIETGGRLIICGAGSSSGRLVESEAEQLQPSYGMDPTKILAISFGLGGSLDLIEDLENKEENGELELQKINLCAKDVVIGVSATGGTPSIIGCFMYSIKVGALKIALCCNIGSKLEELADISIITPVGPEVIIESARHKGGTAHKMVLDMITTSIVVKLGYTYSNIKVGIPTTKPNLREKGLNFIMEATRCSREIADFHLKECKGNIRTAIYMILNNITSAEKAELKLKGNNWCIRKETI